jgi:hypothetical protein
MKVDIINKMLYSFNWMIMFSVKTLMDMVLEEGMAGGWVGE